MYRYLSVLIQVKKININSFRSLGSLMVCLYKTGSTLPFSAGSPTTLHSRINPDFGKTMNYLTKFLCEKQCC